MFIRNAKNRAHSTEFDNRAIESRKLVSMSRKIDNRAIGSRKSVSMSRKVSNRAIESRKLVLMSRKINNRAIESRKLVSMSRKVDYRNEKSIWNTKKLTSQHMSTLVYFAEDFKNVTRLEIFLLEKPPLVKSGLLLNGIGEIQGEGKELDHSIFVKIS